MNDWGRPIALSAFLLTRAGRAKTRNSARGFIEIERLTDHDLQRWCDDELRNTHSALHSECSLPQIHENDLYLAAVIRINSSGGVEHGDTVTHRQARARPHLAFGACRQGNRDAGRDHGASSGLDRDGAIHGHCGEKIEAGRALALIGRQRQIGRMRKPHRPELDLAHDPDALRAAAIRSTNARATSSFDCGGQDSTRSAVIRCTRLRSPPMMPVSAETSLARIQSQPLRASFSLALATTFWVSAAKPITSCGRFALRWATSARMSGFSTSLKVGAAPFDFLIFSRPGAANRQSATAAANTAQSTGRARSTASRISRAVSTLTAVTPSGSGMCTGPQTRITSAPAAAAAAAMAWPCLPEDRLAM